MQTYWQAYYLSLSPKADKRHKKRFPVSVNRKSLPNV